MAHGSKKVVYAAMAGNGIIAVIKFIAASITGSSAMLSEAVHSVVDTGNQGLLLFGMHRANKPADDRHPFGYGMELYFWTFVVAIMVFAVGAGVSIYEGVHKIADPHAVKSPMINYVVLTLALIFEGGAWWVAYKAFNQQRGKLGFIEAVRGSKDPTIFTVLFEDSAAMLGLLIAFVGLLLSQALDMPVFDGIASLMIGIVLAVTASLLAYESKGLLIGEGAHPDVVANVRRLAAATPGVLAINEALTLHFGPTDILLNLSLDFTDDLDSPAVEATISKLEKAIKAAHPEITRVFVEAQSLQGHLASVTEE